MPLLVVITPLLVLLLLPIFIVGAITIPAARYGCAAVLADTTVWFFGGATDSSFTNSLWSIDLSNSWQLALPPWTDHTDDSNGYSFVTPRISSTLQAVSNQKSLLVYGGAIYKDSLFSTHSITPFVQYDIETRTWSDPNIQGPSPSELGGHSAVTDNKGIVYYFGGSDSDREKSWYSGVTGTILRNDAVIKMDMVGYAYTILPVTAGQIGRVWHTATMVFGTKMYIIGGMTAINSTSSDGESHSQPLNKVDVYDTVLNTWASLSTTGPTPPSRVQHSAALTTDGNTIVVFGGLSFLDNIYSLGDLWTLDVNNLSWAEVQTSGTPPVARNNHNAIIFGTQMLIFFGDSGTNTTNIPHNEIHILDMSTTPWSWVDNFAGPPRNSSTITGGIGVIGGVVGFILIATSLLMAIGVWLCRRRSKRADGSGNQKPSTRKIGILSDHVSPAMHNALPNYEPDVILPVASDADVEKSAVA